MLDTSNLERSAGTVIFRDDRTLGLTFLALKFYNKFDLPKGHVEHFDDGKGQDKILSAAIRETYEESGFDVVSDVNANLTFEYPLARLFPDQGEGIKCLSHDRRTGKPRKIVHLFIAETKCPNAYIKKNKDGIYEHQGFEWVPIDSLNEVGMFSYMLPALQKAIELYQTHKRVEETVNKFLNLST